jgi:DNA modification methylase
MGVSLNQSDATVRQHDFRNDMKEVIPSMDYLTHGIHPYTARLIPHIPRYFIEKYTENGETVLDPFCGSGTALLEARLLGRNAIGIDINPLAVLISEVKTTPIDAEELDHAIQLLKKELKGNVNKTTVEFPNIDYWFGEDAQNELVRIKCSIEKSNGKTGHDIHRFLQLCFCSIIRKSSYADPRIAKTYKSKRIMKKVEDGWVARPIQYFEESLDKNFERLKGLSKILDSNTDYTKVFQGDARKTSSILERNGIREVDFIITSPPYINAQDYFRSYKLELWWSGLATPEEVRKLNKQAIGTESLSGYNYSISPRSDYPYLNIILNKIWKIDKKKSYVVYNYFENMKQVLNRFYNVLRNNGHFCLITGCNTICGIRIPTYKIITRMAETNGFGLIELGKDKIKNRSLPPDRNHNGGVIKEEWITVFRKGEE